MSGLVAYCDGGLRRDPPAGGTGAVLARGGLVLARACGHHPGPATNQQMELEAALLAIALAAPRRLPGEALEVRSDSAYLVNCVLQGWWLRWVRNGWRNSAGGPVANAALWRRLLAADRATAAALARALGPEPWRRVALPEDAAMARESAERGSAVAFAKVRGHAGVELNEAADALAARGAAGERGEVPG